MPARAEQALTKQKIVKEWGIKPWEMDKLTMTDMQDIGLAAHAETYIKETQREQSQHGGKSLSHKNYDVKQSRRSAFQ